MIDNNILKNDERIIYLLRSLYKRFGYKPYKMSKFEEYDLYVRNKSFLVSDNIITFNDTDGKLLALKPDVTLSIVKNSKDIPSYTQKVYYNENVYRVSTGTHMFKEIMQVGLECIGNIDIYNIAETISLAAESLRMISDKFVLDVSHMGILSGLIDELNVDDVVKKNIFALAAEKNTHELCTLCDENGIDEKTCEKLIKIVKLRGDMAQVLEALSELCTGERMNEALCELKQIYGVMKDMPFAKNIHFDFSIASDESYYNGIVFKGFIEGIPESVLSGGQYDRLMQKMGRSSGAIGFAVYMDVLEQLNDSGMGYDADIVLLYEDGVNAGEIMKTVKLFTEEGKNVSVQKIIPENFKYGKAMKLTKRGLEEIG